MSLIDTRNSNNTRRRRTRSTRRRNTTQQQQEEEATTHDTTTNHDSRIRSSPTTPSENAMGHMYNNTNFSRTTINGNSTEASFNSTHLFYAMAPKQALNFILHTTILGTLVSLMSLYSIIYLCEQFELSLLQIFVGSQCWYLTFWFGCSLYIQLFSFVQRLVVVKKVIRMLNDDVSNINLMRIDEIDAYYLEKRSQLIKSFYFKINKATGKFRFLVNCFNFVYFPITILRHYDKPGQSKQDKYMMQLFGVQLLIFVFQILFLFIGFFYWTWRGVQERIAHEQAERNAMDINGTDNTDRGKGFSLDVVKLFKSENYKDRIKVLALKSLAPPEKCTVCLEKYKPSDMVTCLPCSDRHFYHNKCIEQWLLTSKKCPLCNQKCENPTKHIEGFKTS